jgi:DNA-directed RNA polymerase specialized sigma24 family protein
MSFPNTRHTLIRRIAAGGDEAAWREFLADYWEPICTFVARRGNLNVQDAEDIAAQVFEAFLRNRLLERWVDSPVAKLRTLICNVVRNVLSNRARVQGQRAKLLAEHRLDLPEMVEGESAAETAEQADVFYAAWVDELLRSSVESLMIDYNLSGHGDYFRVLYARLCEDLTIPEVSELLGIKVTSAENFYRDARQRLMERLRENVRKHIGRYSMSLSEDTDFETEWNELGKHLKEHGGVEQAVRRAYHEFDPARRRARHSRIIAGTLSFSSAGIPDCGRKNADSG